MESGTAFRGATPPEKSAVDAAPVAYLDDENDQLGIEDFAKQYDSRRPGIAKDLSGRR